MTPALQIAASAATTATVVLAGVTLALAVATLALALAVRTASARAREDAGAERRALERRIGAGYRPLLVDVPQTAPLTRFEAGSIHISVPLRNVGHGLAVIDADGVELTGPLVGPIEHRTVQRTHVAVGGTTRIDLVAGHVPQGEQTRDIACKLEVPYSDLAGGQRTVAELQLECSDVSSQWLVARVDHRLDGAVEQIAEPIPAPPADRRPVRPGVRGEPVTDVWGNPVGPRRRKRPRDH